MPELPEVETVKETLKLHLIGKTIIDIITPYPNIIKMDLEDFKSKMINQEFKNIKRYGKYLIFELTDISMISHLRMEGKYYLRDRTDQFTKHEHVIFKLDDGKFLSYHDVRKFGTMELVEKNEVFDSLSLSKLGFEANDPNIDINKLYPRFKNAKRPIKSVLLDQSVITGLGNIYVDETLFRSRIHPQELANNLTKNEVKTLLANAKVVLDKAISLGGTTIRTYQSSFGVDGRFQNELKVHTLVGKPCSVCNTTIEKIRVGGRGTYFCPNCQKLKKL